MTFTKSLLPRKVTYSQNRASGYRHIWRGHYSAYHKVHSLCRCLWRPWEGTSPPLLVRLALDLGHVALLLMHWLPRLMGHTHWTEGCVPWIFCPIIIVWTIVTSQLLWTNFILLYSIFPKDDSLSWRLLCREGPLTSALWCFDIICFDMLTKHIRKPMCVWILRVDTR